MSPEPASRGEETFQGTLYGLTNAFVFFDHMCTATTDMFQNYVGDEMKYSTAWKEPDKRKRGKSGSHRGSASWQRAQGFKQVTATGSGISRSSQACRLAPVRTATFPSLLISFVHFVSQAKPDRLVTISDMFLLLLLGKLMLVVSCWLVFASPVPGMLSGQCRMHMRPRGKV